MKKILLFISTLFISYSGFSQAVTGISVNVNIYNTFEKQTKLPTDTGISITATVIPANAANKKVLFTVDSGNACYFTTDTNNARLNCTVSGFVKITATAQDGSAVKYSKIYQVVNYTTVNSYRLFFDTAYVKQLTDEHQNDSIPVYKYSLEKGSLRIDIDKIGPYTSAGSGIPAIAWKGFSYGFSEFLFRLNPTKSIRLDLSVNKNIRFSMRGSNTNGYIGTGSGAIAPNYDLSVFPNNVTAGPEKLNIMADTVNSSTVVFDTKGYSYDSKGNFKFDSTKIDYFWIIPNDGLTWDTRSGYSWSQSEQSKQNDFKGTIWIDWVAFGAAADSVPVTKITITGNNDIVYQGSNPKKKFKYTFSWAPNDATVDSSMFWWSVSDTSLAYIDGSGMLVPKKAGTVQVICTAQDGSGTKGSLSVLLEGDFSLKNGLLNNYVVFPNPAKDHITILGSENLVRADIISTSGVLVKSVAGQNVYELNVNVNELPSGIYIVKCFADNGEVIKKKFVKQ